MTRYTATGAQGAFQPGSNDRVLANKLGITDPDEMDEVEAGLLLQLYDEVLAATAADQSITVDLIKRWHGRWLSNVFEWAGEERSVNLSKGGFQFAAAGQVPALLTRFDRDWLSKYTPCCGMTRDQVVQAIAGVHVELILIHPFREGNGRLARLVADVMAAQAGFQPLDYEEWERNKPVYIGAIHAGVGADYGPMELLVSRALCV